jgi:hypothetical protein
MNSKNICALKTILNSPVNEDIKLQRQCFSSRHLNDADFRIQQQLLLVSGKRAKYILSFFSGCLSYFETDNIKKAHMGEHGKKTPM